MVNGKKVDRPGYMVETGDCITIRPRDKSKQYVQAQMQLLEGVPNPPTQSWLQVDPSKLEATVTVLPSRDDVLIPVEEQLIVEFYDVDDDGKYCGAIAA